MARTTNEESHLPDKQEYTKDEIDTIDALYCTDCLSLRIMATDDDLCFCDDCFCTDIAKTNIKEWETLYQNRYGHPYVNQKKKRIYGN